MQVQEYRYNVEYSADFYTVNYTSHNFQTFLANESCAGCTLNDTLVTVNRCAAVERAVLSLGCICNTVCRAGHTWQCWPSTRQRSHCSCSLSPWR